MQEQEQITTTDREQITPSAIYQNNIYALVDDVKQEPRYINKTDEELKQDKSFFTSLIDYIYNNYIGELLGNKHGKQIIYKDINQIDSLFYLYLDLVNKYKWNDKPFIVEFSTFTGINKNTFYNWLKGDSDNNIGGQKGGTILTTERSDIVQKWVDICERALLNGSDTIRDIFILKAKHGYRDNNNDIQITVNHKQIVSADDLPALIGVKNGNN